MLELLEVCLYAERKIPFIMYRVHCTCIYLHIYKYMLQRFNKIYQQGIISSIISIIFVKLETEFVGCQFSVFLNISKHIYLTESTIKCFIFHKLYRFQTSVNYIKVEYKSERFEVLLMVLVIINLLSYLSNLYYNSYNYLNFRKIPANQLPPGQQKNLAVIECSTILLSSQIVKILAAATSSPAS